MSEHVVDRIADILEGRLDEEGMRESRRHLDACPECAADFAWAREFRERALAQGLRHLTPERILALAAGDEASAASEEQAHLAACPDCRSELEWSRSQEPLETVLSLVEPRPEPKPEPRPEPGPGPKAEPKTVVAAEPSPPAVAVLAKAPLAVPAAKRPSVPVWLWGGGALALAVVAFVMVLALPGRRETRPARAPAPTPTPATTPATAIEPVSPSLPPVPTLASLARLEPLPSRFTRQGEESGSFDEVRTLGLDAYGLGAYEAAAEHLRSALAMRSGDDEIRLYLGSAELMLRNPNAALPLLETVTVTSDDPAMVADALWQLANAWLLLEDREEALATLQRLSQRGGSHAGAAESLRAEIEKMAGAR